MSLSAYTIGERVWVVHTGTVAEESVPETLPIGSVVLTPHEAKTLGAQMIHASAEAYRRTQKAGA